MSRFVDYRLMTNQEMETERLYRLESLRAVTTPRYFDEGVPSFLPPETNALTNLRDKLGRGSLELGDGLGVVLNSGAGYISKKLLPDVRSELPLSISEDGTALLSDGSIKPEGSLQGSEYFDALDPTARSILEVNGTSREQFSDVTTREEATERYQNIVASIELDSRIRRFNDVHPNYATATGIVGFALELVSDPATLLTLGAGLGFSGVKSLSKEGVELGIKGLTREAQKSLAEEGLKTASLRVAKTISEKQTGLLPTFVREAVDSNAIARHTLATLEGSALTVSFDVLAQMSEYDRRVNDLGIQEEFDYSYARGGVSALLGAFLSNLGASVRGGTPKPITQKDVIASSPTSLVGRRARNLARKGIKADEARADLMELSILDRIDKWANHAYSPSTYRKITDVLENALIISKGVREGEVDVAPGAAFNKETGIIYDLQEVGLFFAQGPTEEEALEALGRGVFKQPKVKALNDKIKNLAEELYTLTQSNTRRGRPISDADAKKANGIRRKIRKIEEEKASITQSGYNFTPDSPEAMSLRSIVTDSPFTTVHNKVEDRLERMYNNLGLTEDTTTGRAHPRDVQATHKVFKWLETLGGLGTLGRIASRLDELGDEPIAQLIAKMYAAYDSRIANDLFANESGESVTTVAENMIRVSLIKRDFNQTAAKVLKGKSADQRQRIGAEVAQLRTGTLEVEQAGKSARDLFDATSKFYDEMGRLGENTGILRNKIDGYMNVLMRSDLNEPEINSLSKAYRSYIKRTVLADKGDDTVLHRGTLVRLQLTDANGKLLNPDYTIDTVKTLGDLLPEDRKLYVEGLDDSLLREAKYSIERRMGRNRRVSEDPVTREIDRPAYFHEDNRAGRRIEQEFFYSDEVISMGVLDTDLENLIGSYERSFGGVIARQMTMGEVFGEAGRFDDFVEVIRREIPKAYVSAESKELLTKALEGLVEIDARTLHLAKKTPTGFERVIQPLVDIASATIQQSIVVAMQTEVATVVLRDLFNKDDIKELMRSIRNTFNGKEVRESLTDIGMAYEYHRNDSRFVGESAFDPVDSVGKGARWWRDKSREWLGEAALTRRLKLHYFTATYSKTARRLIKNIDKLEALDRAFDPADPKAFAQAVRDAGLGGDIAFAREVRRLGLHTKKGRAVLQRFKDNDPEALRGFVDGQKFALREENADLQQDMLDFLDGLHRFAFNDTERVIVTRSAGTQLRSDNVLGNAMLQFLTYPTSWFNGFLRYGSQQSNQFLAGYLATYLIGETFAAVGRDISSGKDFDTVLQEWEDDFYSKTALTATRVPLMGAFSDLLYAPVIATATDRRVRLGLSSNPALAFPERAAQEAVSNIEKIIKGEDVKSSDWKNTMRVLPFAGTPPARYLLNK